jgi:ABC-2 type transport system permease protein
MSVSPVVAGQPGPHAARQGRAFAAGGRADTLWFFYPWFYSTQVVQQVPVALVVHDNSGLARQMLRFAQASPRIDLKLVTSDEGGSPRGCAAR